MKSVTSEEILEEIQYLRALIYGEPGQGKTTLCASACLDELTAPALFLEYRAQIVGLRKNPQYMEAIKDGRLIIVKLEKYSELNHIYSFLTRGRGSHKGLDQVFERLGHDKDTMPKTVVADSLTELQRSEVMRRAGNAAGVFLTDVEVPHPQQWGSLLNQFTLLAHLFFQLPLHIVFSGLETVDYGPHAVGEQAPIVGYRVALQGQAKRQFPAYALTVMRLERAAKGSKTSSGEPVFNVGYTSGTKAKTKDQTGMLPDVIPNPTIPMLVKLLQGGPGV